MTGRPCRVRVVDDEPAMAQLLEYLLPDVIILNAVTNPLEVMVEALWEDVDVGVIDLHLGRKTPTGFDILRWLQSTFPNIRRVVCSALIGSEEIQAMIASGLAHSAIPKPFTDIDLRTALGWT